MWAEGRKQVTAGLQGRLNDQVRCVIPNNPDTIDIRYLSICLAAVMG